MACKSAGLYGGSLPESGGLSGKWDDVPPFVWWIFVDDGDTDVTTWTGVVAVVIAVTDNVIAVVLILLFETEFPFPFGVTNDSNWSKSRASLSIPPMKSLRPNRALKVEEKEERKQ